MELAAYLALCALLIAVFFGAFALGQWIAASLRERRRSNSRIGRRIEQSSATLPEHPT